MRLCERGLHASLHPFDALQYAPGETLCLVELDGEILRGDDKVCARKRKIIARFDATDLLRDQARKSALSVIHLWDAPAVVREYLETGDETKRAAAMAAARDAASDTAWDAAYAARAAASMPRWLPRGMPRYAARLPRGCREVTAARAAAKQRFLEAVEAKFKEIS